MHIARLQIKHFRGIKEGAIFMDAHTVFVGDNNAGKSTVLEAIDLVLGPERLGRRPVVDEHDFFAGDYVDTAKKEVLPIQVEVVVVNLNEEQQVHFRDHLDWWNAEKKELLEGPPAEDLDKAHVYAALRVFFNGWYDVEEDDFAGDTYYASPQLADGTYSKFKTSDKRRCGFLYLRTLRTGSRALSLERGSLLDIILRLQEQRLTMWEDLLASLRTISVGDEEHIGSLLESVQDAVRHYLAADGAGAPHMRVSDLTREMLRKTLTVFIGTGVKRRDGSLHSAPYQHQGTGTVNTLVLALLSIIAELKQNVIFAMEEPEIALPPHTQKRIINAVRQKSAQAIFTSHSPYVLEEFEPEDIHVLTRSKRGHLREKRVSYPPSVKPKAYRAEFRKRFCEAILAKHVLVVEGRTEYDAFLAAARRLCELDPATFKSLENLGVAVIDAEGQTNVAPLAKFFASLGKVVYAVFDKQSPDALKEIVDAVDHPFESHVDDFEDIVLSQTDDAVLKSYALDLVAEGDWPTHLKLVPSAAMSIVDIRKALNPYLTWSKGNAAAADMLVTCTSVGHVPQFVRDTLIAIKNIIEPPPAPPPLGAGGRVAIETVDEAAPAAAIAEFPPALYKKFEPSPPDFDL
ncbi:ATP-dependent nuclease [Hydrogenophaga sp.]|uniref:ATP-dependent nuclease n=1 Tax=Hydrogenophaga sp. TaxID=1904254 RepID=UPI003D2DC684